MMRAERVDLYRDSAGKWRWRYRSSNGRIMADSAQGYRDKVDAIHGLELVTRGTFRNTFTYGPELDLHDGGAPIEVRVLDDKAGA